MGTRQKGIGGLYKYQSRKKSQKARSSLIKFDLSINGKDINMLRA